MPEQAKITAFAQLTLLLLRQNGVPEADITAYLEPNSAADNHFEAQQVRECGAVTMPAKAVKHEMRRLLSN